MFSDMGHIYVRDDKSYLHHFPNIEKVADLSLWKYSFDLVTRELELTEKKKQALNELFESKKISQSTHDYLEKELVEAITDLQAHLNSLTDKMTARVKELEKQIGTLELFLASAEIHYAAGDIDNEAYETQTKAILLGLETTKHELNDIKSSLSRTVSGAVEAPATSITTETDESEESTVAEPAADEVPTLVTTSEQPYEQASTETEPTSEY